MRTLYITISSHMLSISTIVVKGGLTLGGLRYTTLYTCLHLPGTGMSSSVMHEKRYCLDNSHSGSVCATRFAGCTQAVTYPWRGFDSLTCMTSAVSQSSIALNRSEERVRQSLTAAFWTKANKRKSTLHKLE